MEMITKNAWTVEDVLRVINGRNGQFQSITTLTPVTISKKAHPGTEVLKLTRRVMRTGIQYENTKAAAEYHAAGHEATHALPWGEWEVENKIIRNGEKHYLRFYADGVQSKSEYYINGNTATLAQVLELMTPKQAERYTSGNETNCFTVELSHLISIG